MSSATNKRHDNIKKEMNPKGKAKLDHGDAADSNASHLPPTASALTNDDPLVLTTVLEPSKIKNFLYKVEPNMARINATSLDLISTTATLLLKTLVEKAVHEEQTERKRGKTIRKDDQQNEKQVLLTSNRIKTSVLGNTPSALEFLDETYKNFRDKDGSFLPSKLCAYVPRTAKRKQGPTTGPTVVRTSTTGLGQNDREGSKKLKRNHGLGSSSVLLSTESGNDATHIDRAIANAANATETVVVEKIIEDDDDYD